jgi:beta-glucosidase
MAHMERKPFSPNIEGIELDRAAFKSNFLFGVATSALQIEGAVSEDGRGRTVWEKYAEERPGFIQDNAKPDIACDHYHRWREDIELMKTLGVSAYRFSISWPRILPDGKGEINEKGIEFYENLSKGLKEAGITPWVMLYHADLPLPLAENGGWSNSETIESYLQYVNAVTNRLGWLVETWMTFNEPLCIINDELNINNRSLKDSLQAGHHVLLAHGKAVDIIRKNSPHAKVGIVLNMEPVYPASEKEVDRNAAWMLDRSFNHWFLNPLYGKGYPQAILDFYGDNAPEIGAGDYETITTRTDFLGVNYYQSVHGEYDANAPMNARRIMDDDAEKTDFGWNIYPQGLYDILKRIHTEIPDIPSLVVTENGASFHDTMSPDGSVKDLRRIRYLREHLKAVQKALKEGLPIDGYFVWSLMDNFEWRAGYKERFGVYFVDYENNQQRTIKESGKWFSHFIS